MGTREKVGSDRDDATSAEFMQPATEEGSAFVLWIGGNLGDIFCEQDERTVNADNCVSIDGHKLQIPPNKYRCHYVRVKVMVHRYPDGSLAIFHGPRKLADYDRHGKLMVLKPRKAAYPTGVTHNHFPPCSARAAGKWLWITPA